MRKLCALLFVICVCMCMAACTQEAPSDTPLSTYDEPPIPDPLQVSSLLTVEEVQQVTDIDGLAVEQALDGAARFATVDQMQSVDLAAEEMTAAVFDETMQTLSAQCELTAAPNLGEKALWCDDLSSLYVYANGWALDIHVEYHPANKEDSLLAARQLAVLMMDKL